MRQTATQQAIQPRPLTPEQYEQRRRDFYRYTETARRAMYHLEGIQPFRLTMHPDGRVTRETMWLPGAKEAYDRYAEYVEWWAERLRQGGGPPAQ